LIFRLEMPQRLQLAMRPKGGVERLLATLARLLLLAAVAIATYLEIRLSAR
jgi:hypothetical protein